MNREQLAKEMFERNYDNLPDRQKMIVDEAYEKTPDELEME